MKTILLKVGTYFINPPEAKSSLGKKIRTGQEIFALTLSGILAIICRFIINFFNLFRR